VGDPCFGTDKELILETDASGIGLGTVLAEEHESQVHPIAYASRSLDPHERNYGISELETLALGVGSPLLLSIYSGSPYNCVHLPCCLIQGVLHFEHVAVPGKSKSSVST